MRRRDFFLGGGLIGVVAAVVATTRKASQPTGSVEICKDGHMPHGQYMKTPCFAMGQVGVDRESDAMRSLVPCRKCGVLFALTIPKKT